jgi:hypothetical protein
MGPIDAESSIYLTDTWGISFFFAYLRRLRLVFDFFVAIYALLTNSPDLIIIKK